MKKLGKYFTKGLQAGVLATALITGTVGCGNTAGGNGGYEIDDNNGNNGNNNGQGNEWQQPAYYINEELGGQVFVDPSKLWAETTESTIKGYYNDSYTNAKEFMSKKVDELRNAIDGQDNSLCEKINNALNGINQGNNIRDNINNNYNALATVFADLEENHIYTNDDRKYNDYKCSYYKLAHYAYNQALGTEKYKNYLPSNSEMKNDRTSFFVQQLAHANYDYETLAVDEAKKCMNNTINDIANNNGASTTTY